MSDFMQLLMRSMDDDGLRFYLKRHRKQLADAEYHLSLCMEIVNDLEREADKRGISVEG